ncbi:MAG: hypothetical protein EPN19_15740 [Betaproteobacteria bacterium]|nr:MAG: hypothetical protein EPN19_15740 [Betaproteobacteria bacterium]
MKTREPQRRNLLRLMAAGGVALCAPAMWGCKEQQQPAGTPEKPPAGATPAPPSGSGKLSQAEAKYQSTPKAGQKCSQCMHFIADSSSCKLVEGQISPEGWCKLFAAKAA